MTTLPDCRHRKGLLANGRFRCDSPKWYAPLGVNAKQCQRCHCPDHELVDNGRKDEPSRVSLPMLSACEYLGPILSKCPLNDARKDVRKCELHDRNTSIEVCEKSCKDHPSRRIVPVARPAPPAGRIEWIRTSRMVADALRLVPALPPSLAGVAGIPRSGMIPATVLATHLHLPLFELTDRGRLNRLGHGSRGYGFGFPAADEKAPLLVVDDTLYSGRAMRRTRNLLRHRPSILAVVYARPEAVQAVDLYASALPSPHVLEWNWANNGTLAGNATDPIYGRGIACDFDGILCLDPTVPDSDTPEGLERYRRWLESARPLYLPRCAPVPLILTARLERFRPETEAWLKRWGFRWKRLVMHPADLPSARGDVAAWKAREYAASGCGFYAESDPGQAERIWRLSGKPVICPAAGRVWS